ncbi:MAG: TIR domain-containing protein [Clostridiales bacterium]|nr:TIR domain-containing protein [Clostridiales bacterium]
MAKRIQPPYEGEDPYVYISCSHEDAERTWPLIGLMEENGYRVWYEEEDHPGAECSEAAASHLAGCRVFLAFLSGASMESHNCRREFNAAMMEKKPSLCVFLEPVALSPVMKMQLACAQVVEAEKCCGSRVECLKEIMKMPQLGVCREDEETVLIPKRIVREFYLNRTATSEQIHIAKEEFRVGRNIACDYVISDNLTVSRVHAIFEVADGHCTVYDNHSTNKVYVNDRELDEEEHCLLRNGDLVEVGSEKFTMEITE